MYKRTISGSFKNALDWLILLGDRHPPSLTDKVVGLISTAAQHALLLIRPCRIFSDRRLSQLYS